MDASKNVLKPRPNHTISNDKNVKKINRFGLVKPNVGYVVNGYENKNSIEDPQFRPSKLYPLHPSLCASSFKLLNSINVGHDT
jgi:hypothetical protein